MTVGIGVCCQGGQCVIMTADGKGSFADPSLPSHERLGKQYDLPFGLYANIAGDARQCNGVINRMGTAIDSLRLDASPRLDVIQEAIEASRFAESRELADGQLKKLLKITLKEWQEKPSASSVYRRGKRIISGTGLSVELLVGGIIRGSGVVIQFSGEEMTSADPIGCIGTGGDAAFVKLMERSQNVHMSLPRTLLHVAEAMREARLKNPKTVGDAADYVVITEKQIRRMPSSHAVLQVMLGKYADKDSAEIDRNEELWQAIQSAMYGNRAA